jgi:hypothetical protein
VTQEDIDSLSPRFHSYIVTQARFGKLPPPPVRTIKIGNPRV